MAFNDKQTRALWSHALHELAEAIAHHNAIMPTSMDIWIQHGVTVSQLLMMADNIETSIPVRIVDGAPHTYVTLTFPSGAELGVDIKTHVHSDSEITGADRENIAWHNEHCCEIAAPDQQHGSSDPEADIARCEKCDQPVPAEYMAEHLAARHVPAGEYDQADISDR